MIDHIHASRRGPRGLSAAVLLVLGAGVSGCADVGDSFASAAFVDPAKYELFDCKQLEAERKQLQTRTAELQGLIAKANTGTGGAVVGEMVYRNDYISARAQAKLADEMWLRNKCVATTPGPASAPAAPAPKAAARPTSGLY
jgi:hypothetical protein